MNRPTTSSFDSVMVPRLIARPAGQAHTGNGPRDRAPSEERAVYDPRRGYPVVVPCLLYDDLPAAASWLVETLGFREILRATLPDGWTGHIELECCRPCSPTRAASDGWSPATSGTPTRPTGTGRSWVRCRAE